MDTASLETSVARYRATGDPAAFGAVFDATAATLFRLALSLVKDPATAEDVLQETYAVAVRKLCRLPAGRPVLPWLINVLGKEAAKARRNQKRRPDPVRLAQAQAAMAEDRAARPEDEEAVRQAIDALEEPYRSAALLRWCYGLEPAEIAHVRGEPPGTTRSILSRALERLRGSFRAMPAVLFADAAGVRGLSRVRAAVVSDAAAALEAGLVGAGAGGMAAVLVGGLVVKKILWVGGTVVLLLAGWVTLKALPDSPSREAVPADAVSSDRVPGLAASDASRSAPGPHGGGAPAVEEDLSEGRPTARGIVVAPDGSPIPLARVIVSGRGSEKSAPPVDVDWENPDSQFGSSAAVEATHKDGRFEIPIPDIERPRLFVAAKGWCPADAGIVAAGDDVRVVLRPSGAIYGRVMDAKGRGIADARVALYLLLGPTHAERRVASGADGRYRIDDVPTAAGGTGERTARLVVTAAGYARQILDPQTELSFGVRSGGESELNVVLGRGATVEGRVLGEDGVPIAGARLLLWTLDGLFRHRGTLEHPADAFKIGEATTGADGRYAFEGVPVRGFHDPRERAVSLATGRKVAAWLAAAAPGLTSEVREVELAEEDARLHLDVTLRPAFSVEGRVVDSAGRPVAGASVWGSVLREGAFSPIPTPASAQFPVEFGTTRRNGTYRLDGVGVPRPGDPSFTVGAQAPNLVAGAPDGGRTPVRVDVPGPHRGLLHAPDIVLPVDVVPWAQVRVLLPDGRPAPGATVGWWSSWLSESLVRTGPDGRARLPRPEPLTGDGARPPPRPVFAHLHGYGIARVEAALAAGPDETPAEAILRLAPGFRVSGRVSTRGGDLPWDTTVSVGNGSLPLAIAFPETSGFSTPYDPTLANAWREIRRVRVESDGTFVVEDLPEGPYHVVARATRTDLPLDPLRRPSVVFATQSGVGVGASVSLVLPIDPAQGSATLDIRVVDAETGEGVLKPWGEIISDGRRVAGRRVAPGLLRVERVPAGVWQFNGGGEGYRVATLDSIDLTAGAPAEPPVVRLSRGVRVYGTILGPGGKAFVGQVMLEPYDSAVGKVIVSAAPGGHFEALGVPPGTYRVSGVPPPVSDLRWLAPSDGALVEVAAGAREVRVEGTWAQAGYLEVSSMDARFAAKGPVLTVTDASGRVVGRRDGFAATEPGLPWGGALPPGAYVVRLAIPGEPAIERRVEIAAGRKSRVALAP